MMKKYILSLMALAASAFGAAAEEALDFSLFVNLSGGEQVEYAFADMPVATFKGDNLLITVNDKPAVEYAMADVVNITFKGVPGVVENVASDNTRLKIEIASSEVRISGLTEGADVKVYSASGETMAAVKADADGRAAISTSGFNKGVYVVALPGHSFKFIK